MTFAIGQLCVRVYIYLFLACAEFVKNLLIRPPRRALHETQTPHMQRESRSLGRHGSVQLARGQPIVDRGSLFQAQVCWPVQSVAAASAAIALMRGMAPAAGADHNMTAFRVLENGKVEKAYDDDGEARGGQRLMGCLTRLKGANVAVMVSRVWGGQNLGKARFEHIARAAEELLTALGHQPDKGIAHTWGQGRTVADELSSSSEAAPSASGSSQPARAGKKRARPGDAVSAAVQAAERRRLMAEAAERRAASVALRPQAHE